MTSKVGTFLSIKIVSLRDNVNYIRDYIVHGLTWERALGVSLWISTYSGSGKVGSSDVISPQIDSGRAKCL